MTVAARFQSGRQTSRQGGRKSSELLLPLLRRFFSGEDHPIDLPPHGAAQWGELLRLARWHHTVPLVHAAVSRIDRKMVPDELQHQVRLNVARSLQMAGQLVQLLEELKLNDIAAVPFKGITLAARAYGALAMREVGDIDLLIRRDDIEKAVDLLIGRDYRPVYPTATSREARYLARIRGPQRSRYLRTHCEHHLVNERRRVNVDLHWDITLGEFAVRWDLQGMWDRSAAFELAGRQVPRLADEDLLLVLCANGAKDGWDRLNRVCDVAALVQTSGSTLDWDLIFSTAERAGATRILLLALRLASDLLAVALPENGMNRIALDRAVNRLGAEAFDRLLDSDNSRVDSRLRRAMLYLRQREHWSDRLRCCLAHLRPSVGDWAAAPLPPAVSFLHYAIRPFRLAARYGIDALADRATPPSDRASASQPD